MRLKSLPNFLSSLRIVLSPIIPLLVVKKEYAFSFSLIVFLAITDFLDGFLARKLKVESHLGKFLDPLGDKVFASFSLFSYTFLSEYGLPKAIFFSLVLRDIALIAGGLYLKRYNFVPEPSIFGKVTTFLVSLELILVAFLNLYYLQHIKILVDFLFPITLFFIWISFLHYLYRGFRLLQNE